MSSALLYTFLIIPHESIISRKSDKKFRDSYLGVLTGIGIWTGFSSFMIKSFL